MSAKIHRLKVTGWGGIATMCGIPGLGGTFMDSVWKNNRPADRCKKCAKTLRSAHPKRRETDQ